LFVSQTVIRYFQVVNTEIGYAPKFDMSNDDKRTHLTDFAFEFMTEAQAEQRLKEVFEKHMGTARVAKNAGNYEVSCAFIGYNYFIVFVRQQVNWITSTDLTESVQYFPRGDCHPSPPYINNCTVLANQILKVRLQSFQFLCTKLQKLRHGWSSMSVSE
jgi:hypothetical protein